MALYVELTKFSSRFITGIRVKKKNAIYKNGAVCFLILFKRKANQILLIGMFGDTLMLEFE